MTDEQIDDLWIHRPSIHDGQLMPQLRDFARAILARQPAAIGKEAVTPVRIADAERAAYKVSGHRAGEKWTKAFAEALLATPLAKEASKSAVPLVEQDERGYTEGYDDGLGAGREIMAQLRDKVEALARDASGALSDVEYELMARIKAFHTHDFGRGPELHADAISDAYRKGRAASTSANVVQDVNAALIRTFDSALSGVPRYVIDRFGVEHVADGGGWIKEGDLFDRFAASTSANVAQGAEAVATVKVYETYTGQDGWIEVTQEEYDRTKDKYEHRIRRVSAPPAQTALTDDARDAARYRTLRKAGAIVEWTLAGPWKHGDALDSIADAALTSAQSASGDTK